MAVSQMPRTFTTTHVVSTDELNGLGAPNRCDGRLTLTSATPVTTADVTGAGTIYFTPYKGNEVALFDGTQWISYEFTERSLALTLTAANVYDVFLYNNAGTLTLETLIWTNATTRATALVLQDGILCKTGALTRRYLGTIYASGTNTTEDSITKRYVWNYYNRVPRVMYAVESTASWAYNTTSWRASNNSTVERLNFVVGVSEDAITAEAITFSNCTSASNHFTSIGLDSTTSPYGPISRTGVAAGGYGSTTCVVNAISTAVGFHYLQKMEKAETSTTTWYGTAASGSCITARVFA